MRGRMGLVAIVLWLGGCSLRSIVDQSERVDAAGTLEGSVVAVNLPQGDAVVALFRRDSAGHLALYRTAAPAADGRFSMNVLAGSYIVGAFVDGNRDGEYQPDEPGQFYGAPDLVEVHARSAVTIAITVTRASRMAGFDLFDDWPQQPMIGANTGAIATLEDSRFAPENGTLGMWRPYDFLSGPQGGIFLLSEYDPSRVPVLFVHGMGGTPRDFMRAIEALDRKKYQPWVAYYPSGLRLEMVANAMASAMHQLQRRHGFRHFAVVAHSMGGLVAMSYVQKAWESYPQESKALRMLLTVNTPFGGMDSAAFAVEKSPVIVPSWQDVAAGSEFVERLGRMPWRREVPHYLVFSYEGDRNGDGTVPLVSQLPDSYQVAARRVFGFRGSHVGTLSEPAFAALMNRLLDTSLPKARSRAPPR
jgi:pimeloyl-ACP methyl ester carboxylesterase